MTGASVDVPNDVFEELKRHFDTTEIVDLTATVAMENMRARFNRALQVEADGLCMLPAHHPALVSEASYAATSQVSQKTDRERGLGPQS